MTNCIDGKPKAARPAAHRKRDLVILASQNNESPLREEYEGPAATDFAAALMGPPTSIVNC
jgi:hypothetical protein